MVCAHLEVLFFFVSPPSAISAGYGQWSTFKSTNAQKCAQQKRFVQNWLFINNNGNKTAMSALYTAWQGIFISITRGVFNSSEVTANHNLRGISDWHNAVVVCCWWWSHQKIRKCYLECANRAKNPFPERVYLQFSQKPLLSQKICI